MVIKFFEKLEMNLKDFKILVKLFFNTYMKKINNILAVVNLELVSPQTLNPNFSEMIFSFYFTFMKI